MILDHFELLSALGPTLESRIRSSNSGRRISRKSPNATTSSPRSVVWQCRTTASGGISVQPRQRRMNSLPHNGGTTCTASNALVRIAACSRATFRSINIRFRTPCFTTRSRRSRRNSPKPSGMRCSIERPRVCTDSNSVHVGVRAPHTFIQHFHLDRGIHGGLSSAKALPDGGPGPWGDPVTIEYERRDVLLYAVGIGTTDLRFVYEGIPGFPCSQPFPFDGAVPGHRSTQQRVPSSPGPLNIDAERYLEVLSPLPTSGKVQVRSRLIGVHPRGKGNGFCEFESLVTDEGGTECIRMVNGSFRRGVGTTRRYRAVRGSWPNLFTKAGRPGVGTGSRCRGNDRSQSRSHLPTLGRLQPTSYRSRSCQIRRF